MKIFSTIQQRILNCLSDGQCHNGNALGELCGVSRTAVWKQIRQLTAMGVAIECLPQQGYQLQRPFIPLDENRIRRHLSVNQGSMYYHLFAEIDSTNRFLKELPQGDGLQICSAEMQSKGRGRFGRVWQSPFGENIYLSTRWKLDCCLSRLSGLSLVISLSIIDCLKRILGENDIRIKWPNDLLWHDKKLCGVLIEIVAENNASPQVIIGVGLNVNMDTESQPMPDNPWCSLFEISGRYFDRNELIAALLDAQTRYLHQFLQHDFVYFMDEWQAVDYLRGRYINSVQAGKSITGHVTGITEQGHLCLLDEDGVMQVLSSGDTSVKRGV
ncbi:biotin--[acetyl-CoA-carboxylase] ligase [Legionella sp. CNM-4043-24]|uniref:biotin--[acetyl-CoA-carboxylase] ligase n=1 Tax=Legionella sp. CNM-4043-24 TaxID=3421646 RepID=UPI00403A8FC6